MRAGVVADRIHRFDDLGPLIVSDLADAENGSETCAVDAVDVDRIYVGLDGGDDDGAPIPMAAMTTMTRRCQARGMSSALAHN